MDIEQQRRLVEAVVLTAEQEADIDYALANATDPDDQQVAVSASFDIPNRMLLLELKTGQRLAIPQEDIQNLWNAQPQDLVDIEILGPGTALHWEKLMEAVEVDALRRGIYGNQRWMDGLAQRRRERLKRAG